MNIVHTYTNTQTHAHIYIYMYSQIDGHNGRGDKAVPKMETK